tara:strand:+ start:46 stop:453 length:408 start_codon:yes stop_codon:yes gene_type:complete
MPITINGSGTVSGISAGGLPDGCIQSADLAAGVGGIDISTFTENAEGYVKFSNGFTIAWGESSGTSSEAEVTWTYPVTFSTVYRVIHGTRDASGTTDGMMQLVSFSTTAATFKHNKFNTASSTAYATCIAIGKIN